MDFAARLVNARERIYMPELLTEVTSAKTKQEKIDMLHAYSKKNTENADILKDFIKCTFHPAVVLDLPEGVPPYSTEYPDYNLAPNTLNKACKRVPYFVKSHSKYIEVRLKRERLYIQTLESLFKADAELFIMIKDKKIDQKKYKGCNEALFREAFPAYLPAEQSPK